MKKTYEDKFLTKFDSAFVYWLYETQQPDEEIPCDGQWMGLFGRHVVIENSAGFVMHRRMDRIFPGASRDEYPELFYNQIGAWG